KWELRDRKYKALPEDSEWRDPKYKPALVPTLMSDDEDEYDKSGRKTGRFVSRRPTWRSDLMQSFLDAIDAVRGVDPGHKYITRIRGPVKESAPLKANLLSNRARKWMVSATWLEESDNNTRYNNNSYISVSGVAWGDPEDPETLEEKAKTFKEEMRSIKNQKERLDDETGTRTSTKKSKKSSKMSQQKKSKKRARGDEDEEVEENAEEEQPVRQRLRQRHTEDNQLASDEEE
ncbi:hypothetical protein NEOLEDRAFT_1065983, partial [Neolentinus lepideus HHB14362 ss-1]